MIFCTFTAAEADMVVWMVKQFLDNVDPKREDAPPGVQALFDLVMSIDARLARQIAITRSVP